jgi:ketosteroid isomerase-like protein
MPARLHLRGRESGIAVERDWFYVLTVRDGKLLRQEGYDDERSAQGAFRATTEGPG